MDINYNVSPTVRKFMQSNAKMRVLMGPVGCVAPETIILTEYGPLPIWRVDRPMRVLSYDHKTQRYCFAWTGGSYPKGVDYLLQITTPYGKFSAARAHKMLSGDAETYVSEPSQDQELRICANTRSFYPGDLNLPPLQDEPTHIRAAVLKLENYALLAYGAGMWALLNRDNPLTAIDQIILEERITRLPATKPPIPRPSITGGWLPEDLTNTTTHITKIDTTPQPRTYWDCQVLDTNNYVTIDGTIHHNSGKSVACCFEIVRRAQEQAPNQEGKRKSRALIIRETTPQLKDTTIKTWLDWFPPGVCGEYYKTSKTYLLNVGDVECEVMFRALDDADDVANLNSLEVTFAWMNECRDIHPDIVDALSKRVGRYPSKKDGGATWHGMWGDTNPPTIDTWWYYQMEHLDPKDGVSPNNNKWDVFKQPSGRSPYAENIDNLPEDYYDTTGRSDEYVRVFVDGEYGLSNNGTPIYKYFNPQYHIAKASLRHITNSTQPIVVGMDLGLTPAAVLGQMDPRGRLLVFDELVSEDMGAQRFARQRLKPLLAQRFAASPVLLVVDPAGVQRAQTDERSVVDILRQEGLKVIPARSNQISARLNAVDGYLMGQVDGDAAFLLDPRCTRLKAAMLGGYRYDKKGAVEKNNHSHIAEALQYLCLHAGGAGGYITRTERRQILPVASAGWT